MSGKNEFYPAAESALQSEGFEYYDGDRQIQGKSRAHQSKPDYVAVKDGYCIIGEIKSPDEPPTSCSWRQIQTNDSREFAEVREDVKQREKAGMVDRKVGGHEIIIRGQIPDYVSKIGKTYDLPDVASGKKIKGGYTVPSNQSDNVDRALKNCGKNNYRKIDTGNGSVTFIFDL